MTRLPSEGATFGRYRLDRVLGRGGMGLVHAAHDTVLDREVALKIVAPHLADDPEFRARFQHEAEVLARLDSDRIVRIFDHGEHEGSLFIVTQLVDGGDLQRLVAESGPMSPALAVEVVCQVLEGLRDAHAVGVIHRDIKPANVLLRQRHGEVEAFLCDFGIAAAAGGGFTMTGGVAGSLPYMAPERHEGRDATPASDVYAVGCLLWHGLTGSAPYVGTDVEVAMAHIEGRVPQLPGRDDFSRRMNAVLAKAMAKDPRKRYPTARAMLADLQPLGEHAPGVIALPGATALRRPLAVRRRRWVAPVSASVAVVAVVSGVVGVAAMANREQAGSDTPLPPGVTETLRVREAQVAPHVTLSPLRKRDRVRPGGAGAVAPVNPGGGVVAAPPVPAAGPGTAPVPSTAPSTRPPAAPPRARFRCWDRRTIVYDDVRRCGTPRGRAGLLWMFPKATCGQAQGIKDTSVDAERYVCYVTAPSGNRAGVAFTRFTSVQGGRSYYEGWFGQSGWAGWSIAGQGAGWSMYGSNGESGRIRAATYHYAAVPWAFSPSGPTDADVRHIHQQLGAFRTPSQVYGERIG